MNMIISIVSLGVLTLTSVSASPVASANKLCVKLDVPVPIEATNSRYMQPNVDSSIDAIDWTVINAQLCVPSQKSAKAGILQIATPGLAFDKRYFDVEIKPQEYSYVDAAIKKGYSILTYDRLGTGKSEKPNAYDDVQVPAEIEILASLTKIARSGKLISSSKVLSGSIEETSKFNFKPSKVVQIGHSFGSYIISNMIAGNANLSDAAILTAFYPNTRMVENIIDVLHYDHEFPKENDPARFKTVSPKSQSGARAEKIKQPETVGEYASEGTDPPLPTKGFKGPVQFFIGELDNFVCKGDCNNIFDAQGAHDLFPDASDRSYYLQPKTGHASTLSTNATAGYEVIFQYLDSFGL